jgi:hypothetical protein
MEEEIDDDHAMHCVLWLTGGDPQPVIDSLVESINRSECYTPREVREMAAMLCAIGSGLLTHRRSPAR